MSGKAKKVRQAIARLKGIRDELQAILDALEEDDAKPVSTGFVVVLEDSPCRVISWSTAIWKNRDNDPRNWRGIDAFGLPHVFATAEDAQLCVRAWHEVTDNEGEPRQKLRVIPYDPAAWNHL